jgi:hypothetical protein
LGAARLGDGAVAKHRRKRKKQRGLCRPDGSACRKPGTSCSKSYCLRAPFTIEASWTQSSAIADTDTFLFVPPQNQTTGPAPFILPDCFPNTTRCEEAYPFACINTDIATTGTEITTIHQLLPGRYEYWLELGNPTAADEVTVVLKDAAGRVVQQWMSPANPLTQKVGWHVFDVDGRQGRVTSIDERLRDDATTTYLPYGAHDPFTNVCPT